jgi:hypothetical protein
VLVGGAGGAVRLDATTGRADGDPLPAPAVVAAEWAAGVTAVTGMEFGPDGVLRGVGGR